MNHSKRIKILKKKLQNKTSAFEAQKELTEHYHQMQDVATGEIRHEKMNVDYLLTVFEEIEAFTNDKLVKAVIRNAKERHFLDKAIHARMLFS